MEKIGLIVGNGKFPLYFIKEAKNSNISVYPIGLFPSVDEEIKKLDNYIEFNIGHIGEIIKYLLLRDITKIVMLGKVEKNLIFSKISVLPSSTFSNILVCIFFMSFFINKTANISVSKTTIPATTAFCLKKNVNSL